MKLCGKCKNKKPESEFARKRIVNGVVKLQWQCKSCQSVYRTEHYKKNRRKYIDKANSWGKIRREKYQDFIFDYFKTNPCVDCGNSDPVVLEFDHLRDKEYTISDMFDKSWDIFLNEIKKCEVVCSNCHKIRTASRGQWNKFIRSRS